MENAPDKNTRQDLLKRYLANECTPEERASVEKWYESLGAGVRLPAYEEEVSLGKIRQNLLANLDNVPLRRGIIRAIHPFLRVAAVLLLVVGGGLLIYHHYFQNQIYDKAFVTRKGELKTIVLPDSTIVTLNANSSLRIHYDVRKNQRQATLSGEACFKVAKNPESPFKVQTDQITTQVLGTTFNVEAYAGESAVSVTVAEGKVAVAERNGKNEYIRLSSGLIPDQQLLYNRKTGKAMVKSADSERILSWREGVMIFENASLAEIAAKLERKYNLGILVVGEPDSACRYTFSLRDEPLAKAFQILEKVSGTEIVKNKSNQFTFNTSTCK